AGQAKKRFILVLPTKPDDEKWADVVNSWEIGILTLITLQKDPSGKDRGIKGSDIKYETYADPEQGKQRDQL
ncbi:5851_t:CDS:1, partial [Cetraspora pellucida]